MSTAAPGDPGFRCAAASLMRAEPMTGTASTIRAFLLIEETGPWGEEAMRDARLPDGLGPRIRDAAKSVRVRPMLMRRPDRSGTGERRVIAAHTGPHDPWLEVGAVADLREVLDLDLTGLGAGRTAGLERQAEPVFGVCTHGRHDACCAERGRPAAAALEASYREHTWEVSHMGGDRFAGNLLVLPLGLYYGRVDSRAATRIAAAHLAGELVLDHFRGRSSLAMPVQAAEIDLRRRLTATRDDDVRFVDATRDGSDTIALFSVRGQVTYAVRVRSTPGEPQRLTCGADRDQAARAHEVVEVTRAS